MSPSTHVILSMSLTMGVPLLWAVRELFVMHRANGGGLAPQADEAPAPKPLPSGLIPPDYALQRARAAERVSL